MPELPEVEWIARRLRPALVGRTIEAVTIVHADILARGCAIDALVKRTIATVGRHGKMLLIGLDDDRLPRATAGLVVRLGMTGQCLLVPRGSERALHTHAVVVFSGEPFELHYRDPRRFGKWRVVDSFAEMTAAPDALTLRRKTWRAIVRSRRGQLRPLLMNQHILSGIGNIYANEILFAARLHPRCEASRLTTAQRERLYDAIKSTLRRGIRHGGATIRDYRTPDGAAGRFQDHFRVYGRADRGCSRRCGATVERLKTSRDAQPGFFCPRCQSLSTR